MPDSSQPTLAEGNAPLDLDELFQPGAITLPKGDWHVEPPVQCDHTVHARSDGACGQCLSLTYAGGYQALVHIDASGTLRCQLLRYDAVWPADVHYGELRTSFRGLSEGSRDD